MRCAACRRPLTNPVSLRYGMGPDCLKRAAKAGTAPLEALAELKAWERSKPRPTKRESAQRPAPCADNITGDLFEPIRKSAIDELNRAAEVVRGL